MSMEGLPPAPRADVEATRADRGSRYLQWSPILLGAFAATALSFVMVTFGASVGLGVTSAAPTWRDASVALWILSGIYLILQAILSFGLGGYIAGWVRTPAAPGGPVEHTEQADGLHGLAVWALAVVMGAVLATLLGAATLSRTPTGATSARTSAAEPLLSYELDRLYRAGRRAPTVDLSAERAEAGRILLTTSSHDGLSADDRTYLIQQVVGTTGLAPADAERRVDTVIANAKTAIARSRRSTIILAFSVATAILLGAISAWAAACAGGRHRDGEPLPEWMAHANALDRRRTAVLP
ncbi:hypothetical protein [Bradyrhizobium betae]|uniref:PhnA-like protein n=1 Tax=Bradyrhizobium betae TaxID=244734 RepID=A0A5P6P9Y7_9BRAD|nr:hypothetical protein [Bradyrhizobium betae]QFI75085.1 hypothetical protein F8237_23375 [Bradyrhizobium betae]